MKDRKQRPLRQFLTQAMGTDGYLWFVGLHPFQACGDTFVPTLWIFWFFQHFAMVWRCFAVISIHVECNGYLTTYMCGIRIELGYNRSWHSLLSP